MAGAELLLSLAGKDPDGRADATGPLTCADVLPFGQSLRYSWIKTIAKNCPISMCAHDTDSESERIFSFTTMPSRNSANARLLAECRCKYNKYASACRISCACDRTAGLTTTDGKPLCIPFESLPPGYHVNKPFNLNEFRCDGETSCRPLPFAPSALAAWNLGLSYAYSATEGFCRGERYGACGSKSRASVASVNGLTLSDGVWALANMCVRPQSALVRASARVCVCVDGLVYGVRITWHLRWQCVSDTYGEMGLDVDTKLFMVSSDTTFNLLNCMHIDVDFEGAAIPTHPAAINRSITIATPYVDLHTVPRRRHTRPRLLHV